ncbi:hypothetical protein H6G00_00375 [Leptolyngbya sp. FACHB-541]|uniref:hypothetical protein n=1 Tax=Leptolyngbya sp. FACHB-541 TaxID=2692810 RepID=UPI001682CF21|nr:hypothetical protein [Leptolyngbya sp. FACHB-541]MBD1995084.1 hypothetical protein [Leptolyngbya sp. FACHB-541]
MPKRIQKKLVCRSMPELPALCRACWEESPFLFARLLLEVRERYGAELAERLLDETEQHFAPGRPRPSFVTPSELASRTRK